jgi:uncharacterized repeat protein (TIGR01451 family)
MLVAHLIERESKMYPQPTLHRTLAALLLSSVFIGITPIHETAQAALAFQSPQSDWPMYQHDPAHSGRTPATVFNGGPLYLQWAYAFGERVEMEAQPVVADGVIYQGVMNGEMHAIDANTGTARWVVRPGGPIPHTAAVYGNRVYFGSLDGSVYALSTADGHTVWQFRTDGPVMSAPALVDGRLYVGSNDGNLYALDAATGAELWRVETGGPVVSSPAVAGGRVYFGSEDMMARCVDATTGETTWATTLHGAGMHNTHPVISDDGSVVIFLTVKAGGSSYVHLEGYPDVSRYANPVETWNTYYQHHPTHRFLYYLDADTGADLWDPATLRYVPMPIPYWGLLHPILGPDGNAWFPAPAGTEGYSHRLDHDDRLFRVNLSTGVTSQVAGGSMSEFQLVVAEAGRHVFSGDDYYYTVSEDLGVYRPTSGTMRALFTNGDPSGYNFGSHMDPHSPLPSRHLWRYGGAIAMGGVPGASPPIVANNMIYFTSYGWLYAVGQIDHGYDPATSFPSRDARLHELTYPRSDVPILSEIRTEVAQRVADIVALGPDSPPITARWEQAGSRMLYNEFTFELYGFEADLVRVLAEAYPHLPSTQQAQLKRYLSRFVADTLLNADHYAYRRYCTHFGQEGVYVGDENCLNDGKVTASWLTNNPNLVGMRLYALWAYANATGDWGAIEAHWSLITQQFQKFVDAYDPALGFCDFEEWLSGRLNIGVQIGAAQAVRDMAAYLGHHDTKVQADALLINLLDGRVALADFVSHLYDIGALEPARLRLNPDGTINNDDIMGPDSPYNNALIPYRAALRDRSTDPSQVNWWDGDKYRIDAGIMFMTYPALSGYFPLCSEMTARLRTDLLDETRYYVNSYEVNNPWWWMSDLAHHTTCGGEHLYHSPTLAWTLFQVKARVLQEDWHTLVRQLPEPVSFNSRYDLYRLQNLVTLLDIRLLNPVDDSRKEVTPVTAEHGDTLTYTLTIIGSGRPMTVTDSIPAGTSYVTGHASVNPGVGRLVANPSQIMWTGTVTEFMPFQIAFQVRVEASLPVVIRNTAELELEGDANTYDLQAVAIANGLKYYLPLSLKH